uniref:Uncharacterized protein n=1 Tax=Zea mays TaxID=4577 RepID=A0A804UIW4_MAIZE
MVRTPDCVSVYSGSRSPRLLSHSRRWLGDRRRPTPGIPRFKAAGPSPAKSTHQIPELFIPVILHPRAP